LTEWRTLPLWSCFYKGLLVILSKCSVSSSVRDGGTTRRDRRWSTQILALHRIPPEIFGGRGPSFTDDRFLRVDNLIFGIRSIAMARSDGGGEHTCYRHHGSRVIAKRTVFRIRDFLVRSTLLPAWPSRPGTAP